MKPRFESRQGPADFVVEVSPGRFLRADATGRWITLKRNGPFLHRTLDGEVVLRQKRGATTVDPESARRAHRDAVALADEFSALLDELSDDAVHLGGGDRSGLKDYLARVGEWPIDRHDLEQARYRAAYPEPVTILPPDRYRDVVVLPAVGCANRGCTFCTLHQDRPFRALEPDEFDAHLDGVRALFGPLLAQRDGVFLGSASALSLSDRRLRPMLDRVAEVFGPRRRGVASFFDPDLSPRRTAADWSALADAGLVLAVLGLETGDPELRAALGKRSDLERLAGIADELAEGGLRRGITLLVGAGGPDAVDRHRDATVAAIERLALQAGDLVYVSPLAGSLPIEQLDEETEHLRRALRPVTPAKVVPYRFELFRYYA
jgi:radical SAM superfamily enzyme YgiQ (UPF0313 family)